MPAPRIAAIGVSTYMGVGEGEPLRVPESQNGFSGTEKGDPSSGALLAGRGRAGEGTPERGSLPLGRAALPTTGLRGDLGRQWLAVVGSTRRALKRDPLLGFQLQGCRQDKEGPSQLGCVSHGSLQGAGGICQ